MDRRSARFSRFCTQATSVLASARRRWPGLTLLRPTPPVVPEHAARRVPARADLADQGQSGRIGMQRRTDQFVGDAGAVVLGGVDVIDAGLHASIVGHGQVRRHHRNPVISSRTSAAGNPH
jgi:hypothetical protein